jgi:hypothetical protein
MLGEEDYGRLRAACLAMAQQAHLYDEQTRWIALGRACQELRTGEMSWRPAVVCRGRKAAQAWRGSARREVGFAVADPKPA